MIVSPSWALLNTLERPGPSMGLKLVRRTRCSSAAMTAALPAEAAARALRRLGFGLVKNMMRVSGGISVRELLCRDIIILRQQCQQEIFGGPIRPGMGRSYGSRRTGRIMPFST